MIITISRPIDTNLKGDPIKVSYWEFILVDYLWPTPKLVLNEYRLEIKLAEKKKWKVDKKYSRLFPRETTLSLSEVPFPDSVVNEAKQKLIDSINIVKSLKKEGDEK